MSDETRSAVINFRETPAQRRRLHALAEQRGVTLSEYVREAVDVVAAVDGIDRVLERDESARESRR